MIEFPIVEFETMKDGLQSADCYKNELLVSTITPNTTLLYTCMRINALQVLLVQEGSLEVTIDYKPYTITANTVVTILPTHIVQSTTAKQNFKGLLLAVSRSFLEQSRFLNETPEISSLMNIRKNPIIQVTKKEMDLLDKCLVTLRHNIKNTSHKLHRLLLVNNVQNIIIEFSNMLYQREEFYIPQTLSRKEEIFAAFIKLLFTYCHEEHSVSFYSDKLFITPQYLSLILKEQTGKSANKWIDEALIQEAKILLKAPQATVQQVADILHFSDQSTFGKFFKKHMGICPMEYRKYS